MMVTDHSLVAAIAPNHWPASLAISDQTITWSQLRQSHVSLKESMHWLALENWLHHSQATLATAQSLGDVQGLIEASYHSRMLQEWNLAYQLLSYPVGQSAQPLYEQLTQWGQHRRQLELWTPLLGKLEPAIDLVCLNELGHAHRQLGELATAETYHRQQLDRAQRAGNDYEIMRAIGGLGYWHNDCCQFRAALAAFERQQVVAHGCGASLYEIDALSNVARLQATIWGHKQRGVVALMTALAIAQQVADPGQAAKILSNLGDCYLWNGDYTKALAYHQQVIDSPGYALLPRSNQVMALHYLGMAQAHQNQAILGLATCQKALDLARAHDLIRIEMHLLFDISLLFSQFRRDVATAITYAHRSLCLAQRLSSPYHILRGHANLAIYYATQSESEQAEQHFQWVEAQAPALMPTMQPSEKVHILACIAQIKWLRGQRLQALGLVIYSLIRQPPWSNVNGRMVLRGAIATLFIQPWQRFRAWWQSQR